MESCNNTCLIYVKACCDVNNAAIYTLFSKKSLSESADAPVIKLQHNNNVLARSRVPAVPPK